MSATLYDSETGPTESSRVSFSLPDWVLLAMIFTKEGNLERYSRLTSTAEKLSSGYIVRGPAVGAVDCISKFILLSAPSSMTYN